MCQLFVDEYVVAHRCKHKTEKQSLAPDKDCVFYQACVLQALQARVIQVVSVIVTVEHQRLLHLENFFPANTVLHLFHAIAKMSPPKEKEYGSINDMSVPSPL